MSREHAGWSLEIPYVTPSNFPANRIAGLTPVRGDPELTVEIRRRGHPYGLSGLSDGYTDVSLLALAVQHAGRFVTFDDTVPISAVPPGSKRSI
jgi:hypothetical protein